ncbi:MAG: cytidylate kinase [Candidatus Pacebacteria bacterium CG_4_10_14_0_8_um_filter_43_12]|nr:MAG: cytidylate kinase [Candidatus Pacebacteria bacterium CG10_big_fil_rev_8_21_14_0_10_44_11]PIY79297.1 MAG: cytidylate kinase [Candidatus Pacebacteria bacterium CG_4_10_14_0_8_um_filter_43_12]
MSKPFAIAIDGPVAAGKGTVSRLVADRLGFLYVDTGAMYRVGAWLGLQRKVDWKDEAKIAALITEARIEMRNPTQAEKDSRLTTVIVNGEDVSWKIRTEAVSQGASAVAVHPLVRKVLVHKQQLIAKDQNVVMEGRDITHTVLPNAQVKIYLTAGDTIRARRRHLQLLTKGIDVSFEEVYTQLLKRDKQDMERKTDPLKIVPEAWVLDTSDLSIEQVVEIIVSKVTVMRQKDE